ncbi:MAG: UTP--glucose-1-phosphate uridylyltransferase [Zetaproteobacteria bacterium CG2_30_46_52]|nr:MAG: UTP--glucose-1-phosphate uridylyltransferase [Zetaproteobacteria bacterium CG2_30_46_52]
MPHSLRKIVFPAAGMGTRFLPATKSTPKEMLTVVDRPLIQYGVEEALKAGMDDIIMITGRGKRAIEDHFDISAELEANLRATGKSVLYEEVSRVSRMAAVAYVRQKEAKGLGHAVLCAEPWVGDECFGVSLADELMVSDVPVMQQLRLVHEALGGCSVVALARVPEADVSKYGIVEVSSEENGVYRLTGMVEKPKPEDAPSNLAMIGRYIFTPSLFAFLNDAQPSVGGEIQLTDAMQKLAAVEPMYGVVVDAERFDAGNPLGFLIANLTLGVRHPQYGDTLREYLKKL